MMVGMAKAGGVDTLEAVIDAAAARMGWMNPKAWSGCHRLGYGPVPGANPDADPDHPFYGREIVFTGALGSMARAEAWKHVAELGGQPADGVSKRTNVLVLGYQDARKLRPGEELSAKARKARDLRSEGREIELMGEVDFLQLLAL